MCRKSRRLTIMQIEQRMDGFDLAPCIEFVNQHLDLFNQGMLHIIENRKPPIGILDQFWLDKIQFQDIDNIVDPQLNPEIIRNILLGLPKELTSLSCLRTVRYYKVVPVPIFDQYGNFLPKKVQYVEVENFPRFTDHPTRVLVGSCDGKQISLTPIPINVFTAEQAVWFYQLHVFLHEFFHSIEYLYRDPKERSKIILQTDSATFTFQKWWENFEELILSRREPRAVSRYAATYRRQLTPSYKKKSPKGFTHALAEQICETFVAYMLNIIANDDGWTDFRQESFGNTKQAELFQSGRAPAANRKWMLMDQLCRARVMAS